MFNVLFCFCVSLSVSVDMVSDFVFLFDFVSRVAVWVYVCPLYLLLSYF